MQFLESQKTSATDWLEYSHICYNSRRPSDIDKMSFDNFIIIKLVSEMPVDLHSKIFTMERSIDSVTWPIFIQTLTNLVSIEKVTKTKKLSGPLLAGAVNVKGGGGKQKFPNSKSIVDVVKQMGCLRCLGQHQIADCTVPKTVVCHFCSKTGHKNLPPGHAALQVAAKLPALAAPAAAGQGAVAGQVAVVASWWPSHLPLPLKRGWLM